MPSAGGAPTMGEMTTRPQLLALALALLALVAAGCGGGGEPERADPAPVDAIAPERVIEQFAAQAGRPLVRAAGSEGEAWDVLGFGEDVPEPVYRRYGTFSVYVAKREHKRTVSSLMRDKTSGKPLERKGELLWEFDELSQGWVAHKQYGPNVVLVWFSEKKQPRVDARWHRLDRLLEDVAR